MLVKDEVLLEALKAVRHEPPRTPRVAEEAETGAVAADGAETPCEADVAAPAGEHGKLSQTELGIR